MYEFRKISAISSEFREVENRFSSILSKFVSFLQLETLKNPAALTGESGKASSYKRYLVKLYMITQPSHKGILDISNIEFVNLLKKYQSLRTLKDITLRKIDFRTQH